MQIVGIEAVLLIFLLIITLTIIFTKDLLAAIIVYSGFSFCAMLLYIIMGAADVAFTEAVIGVISTIYFVIAIKSLGKMKSRREKAAAAAASGVAMADAEADADAEAGAEAEAGEEENDKEGEADYEKI